MKILILNPPANEKHIRSNYCSNVSKGVYYYPPIDCLVQSGILGAHFDVSVLDAIADECSASKVLELCKSKRFDGVYAVTGSASRLEDLAFFARLKDILPASKLLITGGYLLTQHQSVLRDNPAIDGVLLDWASHDSASFFKGEENLHFVAKEGFVPDQKRSEKIISYPLPHHQDFPLEKYHHPNAVRHPYSKIMSSAGCPYTCDYCIYSITPYFPRPVEEVVDEMRYMVSLGIHEAFFYDPTFAVKRREARELLQGIRKEDLDMGWFCQTRVDLMDREILTEMKAAGCHSLMFGVESASEALLKEHERRLKHEQTEKVFRICQDLGIRTLSYLIIGLPGDTRESITSTVDFVKRIETDFVSFNLAIPVIGTKFRDTVISQKLVDEDVLQFDNSSEFPTMKTREMTKEELSKAHKNAIIRFYLRPAYLLRRLFRVRSFYELKNHLREGFSLFRQALRF